MCLRCVSLTNCLQHLETPINIGVHLNTVQVLFSKICIVHCIRKNKNGPLGAVKTFKREW